MTVHTWLPALATQTRADGHELGRCLNSGFTEDFWPHAMETLFCFYDMTDNLSGGYIFILWPCDSSSCWGCDINVAYKRLDTRLAFFTVAHWLFVGFCRFKPQRTTFASLALTNAVWTCERTAFFMHHLASLGCDWIKKPYGLAKGWCFQSTECTNTNCPSIPHSTVTSTVFLLVNSHKHLPPQQPQASHNNESTFRISTFYSLIAHVALLPSFEMFYF